MKGQQTALLPGTEDRVGYWITPPELMSELQEEFKFNFDACPFPRPAGFNGLVETWGTRTWCNPPFRGPKVQWARKAIAEYEKGKLIVMILGAGNLSHVVAVFEKVPDLEIRAKIVRWLKPDGRRYKHAYGALLFILRPTR